MRSAVAMGITIYSFILGSARAGCEYGGGGVVGGVWFFVGVKGGVEGWILGWVGWGGGEERVDRG